MGDYNADTDPDIARAQVLARNYNFCSVDFLRTDQWTIDFTNRVNNFANGTGKVKFKIKSDPTIVPLF